MSISLIRLPIDPENIVWLVLEPHLWRPPFSFRNFGRYPRRGWHSRDKSKITLALGSAWSRHSCWLSCLYR